MRENDKAFDNIIDSMGGVPPAMMPPPTSKEKAITAMKVAVASVLIFWFQSALVGFLFMLGYEMAASEFGWATTGVGFWFSTFMAMLVIAIGATLRRATA